MRDAGGIPGLPLWRTDGLGPALAGFLSAQAGVPVAVTNLRRFTAGLSWVTVAFTMTPSDAPARDLILRIGDPNGLLAPYSTEPEVRAFTALAGTDAPVPGVLWHSDDPEAFGAPFMIVTRMPGETLLPRWPGLGDQAPYPHAETVAEDFARHLATIHGCPWRGTPAEALSPGVTADTCTHAEIDRWVRHASGPSGGLEDNAMRFAAMRAAKTGGGVAILSIIAPEDFSHWIGVGEVMREEAKERIEAHFEVYAKWMRDRQGIEPELVIREGSPTEEIHKLIEDDQDIAILVLAAGGAKEGPGPLVASVAGKGAAFPIPVTVVPMNLSDEDIESLA